MLSELPFGELPGFVAANAVIDEPNSPVQVVGPGEAVADPAGIGWPLALYIQPTPLTRLTRSIAYLGVTGFGTATAVYLFYRGHAFFEACHRIHPALGVVYLIAIAVAVLSLGYFLVRAARRYGRLGTVQRVRRWTARAEEGKASDAHQQLLRHWINQFVQSARGRPSSELRERANRLQAQLARHSDAQRAVRELEEYLLRPLDELADKLIQRRASEVAVGTALASGLLDSIIVSTQAIRLVDEISQIYSGRPGLLGTVSLLRRAIGVTLFAEIAEQAAQLFVGIAANTAAAKLGGRAAQGFANGLLIGRLGHAIKQQCRPIERPRTRLTATELIESVLP